MTDIPSRPNNPTHVTRRSVVRTAGAAAWTAPVIVAATAVPAVAASGIDLDIVNMTGSRSVTVTYNYGILQFQVQNNSTTPWTGALTVSVTVNATTGDASGPAVSPNSGAGWAQASVSETGTGFTATYTRASATLAVGATTPILRIYFNSATLALIQTGGTGSATVTSPASANNQGATKNYPAS
ncbi:hypothetical protein [Nocardioides litoris]|uniref:hypothetical protein n=1 Tax=Nocardioides litoris TaxID=1926648 RepID=UPI00111FDD7F|nr:hypothetical protein [Nocardioides litoris]